MKIAYLGHAGFFVDCGADKILCDPWFDPAGAYAASWFPFPSNRHIELDDLESATHLYISHWHRDHFDAWFLRGRSSEFKERVTVVVAQFKYPKLTEWIAECGYSNVHVQQPETLMTTPTGTRLFIQADENPLYTDSSITIGAAGSTFVNMNDCKLSIAQEDMIHELFGPITALAAQYSGATFHPTCYDYSADEKREISAARRVAKFKRVSDSIERLSASAFIPSAGPACFLSDDLRHLNLSQETVFSSFNDLDGWFNAHASKVKMLHLVAGDVALLPELHVTRTTQLVMRYQSKEYIEAYALERRHDIARELSRYEQVSDTLGVQARDHFTALLRNVPLLARTANVVAEIVLSGENEERFFVDTALGRISESDPARRCQYYRLTIGKNWMQAIVDGKISWEDFILSFRLGIHREPDVYNEAFVAFLQLESASEREDYLQYLVTQSARPQERIRREIEGRVIEYDRYCPHNGEDLTNAEIRDGVLTCPRHFWRFSIEQNGKGLNNPCSIELQVREIIC